MITLAHSACLLFAGTFEPAYLLTISTLPQFTQPATNKRNAALTQSYMTDVLGVPPDRGVVHFKAIADENLAYCGKTVLGQIDETDEAKLAAGLKRVNADGRPNRKSLRGEKRKSLSLLGSRAKEDHDVQRQPSTKSSKSTKSTKSYFNGQRSPPLPSPELMLTINGASSPPSNSNSPNTVFELSPSGQAPSSRPVSAKKSILKMSGQDQSMTALLRPPPIPEETPSPKISKRKSLIAMFKR
jgi:Macrophage migration inhibitory factor (MIF)